MVPKPGTYPSIVLLVVLLWQLSPFHFTESPPNFCPRSTTRLGSRCLLMLHPYGNFSHNLEQCQSRDAGLLTLSSVKNLKDVCKYISNNALRDFAFLGADQDQNDTSEYIWHHNNSRVNFPREYWMDEVPQALKCIEVFSFRDYCRINDIVCWKKSLPICEFPENPCVVNNGDCEQICVARGFRIRTCKCVTGYKINETHCVVENSSLIPLSELLCPNGFTYIKNVTRAGSCLKYAPKGKFSFSDAKSKCEKFNSRQLTLSPGTIQNVCNFVHTNNKSYDRIWLAIRKVNGANFVWEYDNLPFLMSDYKTHLPMVAPTRDNHVIYVLNKASKDCTIASSDSSAPRHYICQRMAYTHPCSENNGGCSQTQRCVAANQTTVVCLCSHQYQEINGTCVDINECENTDNGGCHHFCNNTIGGVKCSCRDGYSLDDVHHTECIAECNHQTESKEYVVPDGVQCGCLQGYVLVNDSVCVLSKVDFNNKTVNDKTTSDKYMIILFGLSLPVCAICVCSAIFMFLRRKMQRWEFEHDATTRREMRAVLENLFETVGQSRTQLEMDHDATTQHGIETIPETAVREKSNAAQPPDDTPV